LARERVAGLRLRHANAPLTRQFYQVYRLLGKLDTEPSEGEEALPKLLYVFSDRTQECWDAETARSLKQPPGVNAVFVDVGVENPADVAVVNLELPLDTDRDQPRQVFGTRDRLTLRATVRAIGGDCDTELFCRVDGRKEPLRQHVVVKAGQSVVIPFEFDLQDLKAGPHAVAAELATNDALPFDNARYITFEIRDNRQVLLVADDPANVFSWQNALKSKGTFHADVKTTQAATALAPEDLLKSYKAVCLLGVREPPAELWAILKRYVEKGGGLAVAPGEKHLVRSAYTNNAAGNILPGELVDVVEAAPDKPVRAWGQPKYQHPLLAPFRVWSKTEETDFLRGPNYPLAYRHWQVKPVADDFVLLSYEDMANHPALLERTVQRGRVLLFTTPFDDRQPWDNYRQWWYYLALVNESVGYLAGEADTASLNFQAGQTVSVALPATPRFPNYTLSGPGLTGAENSVSRPENDDTVPIAQATTPGNFTLYDGNTQVVAGFSVNARPEESLLDRVSVESIEAVLGPGAVLGVGHDTNLGKALEGRWSQPVELYPWLMILLLLALTAESFLANRFYRRTPMDQQVLAPLTSAEAKEGVLV